mmetsp:Transcript_41886/g.111218  ORF Transcript_41886/g.111218 Transcript_41886/m.111218 type:complete len:222 (+) Transcript_41886:478-1143(+)
MVGARKRNRTMSYLLPSTSHSSLTLARNVWRSFRSRTLPDLAAATGSTANSLPGTTAMASFMFARGPSSRRCSACSARSLASPAATAPSPIVGRPTSRSMPLPARRPSCTSTFLPAGSSCSNRSDTTGAIFTTHSSRGAFQARSVLLTTMSHSCLLASDMAVLRRLPRRFRLSARSRAAFDMAKRVSEGMSVTTSLCETGSTRSLTSSFDWSFVRWQRLSA